MRTLGVLLLIVCATLAVAFPAHAQEDDFYSERTWVYDPDIMVNHPVNIQGLTGLLVTNSAYSQPKGRFTVGLSGVAENSSTPDYSVVQGSMSVTYGATDRVEVGVKAKAVATNVGRASTRKTGAGDTDFLVKWRVSSQTADLPAIALGMALTLPTGDRNKGMSEIRHEGVRLMLIGTHEQEMPGGIVLGLYVDGQAVFNDQLEKKNGNAYADKYGIINAGILFPIVESNRLQVIIEYNGVTKKSDRPDILEQNYSALTPALRYVTPSLNITAGVQFLSKEDSAIYGNDERYIGTLSYLF
jgi:hypothetical protein